MLSNAGTASPVYVGMGTNLSALNGFPVPSGVVPRRYPAVRGKRGREHVRLLLVGFGERRLDHLVGDGPDRYRHPRLAHPGSPAFTGGLCHQNHDLQQRAHAPSGYGTQAAQLGRTLRRHGHEVAFAAYWGLHGAPITWEGFPVYPGSGEDPYARDVLPGHYRHFGADLLITLLDIWVLDPEQLAGMNVLHWMPVDCTPLSGLDRRCWPGPARAVAFSRFGQKQIQDAGFRAFYAPHALDMSVWSPLTDREKAGEHLGFADKFVIGINAANQDPERKGYFEQFAAFAEFSKRHDDARMIIHTRVNTQQGVDIGQVIADLGIQGKAVPGDQYAIASGMIGDSQMVSWHGVMDVLSNCSYGEGFGLAILQSQACGIPVVVTDFSAMPELCGAGWKVKGQERWNRGHNAKWVTPSIPGIIAAYEKAYLHARDPEMREKARKFAVRYDADLVYRKYWAPILAEVRRAARRRRPEAARADSLVAGHVPRRARHAGDAAHRDGRADRPARARGGGVTHRGVPKPLHFRDGRAGSRAGPAMIGDVDAALPEAEPWVTSTRSATPPGPDRRGGRRRRHRADLRPGRDPVPVAARGAAGGEAARGVRGADADVPVRRRLGGASGAVPPTCVIATAGYIRRNGGSLAAIRDRRRLPGHRGRRLAFLLDRRPGGRQGQAADRDLPHRAAGQRRGRPDRRRDPVPHRGERRRPAGRPVDVDETWPAWIRDRRCPEIWFRPRETAEVRA